MTRKRKISDRVTHFFFFYEHTNFNTRLDFRNIFFGKVFFWAEFGETIALSFQFFIGRPCLGI